MKLKFLKILGWIFIPYIMIFVYWKKLSKPAKITGAVWAVIVIFTSLQSQSGNKDTQQQVTAPVEQKTNSDDSSNLDTAAKQDTTNQKSVTEQTKSTSQNDDFQPKHNPEVAAVARKGGLGDTFEQLKNQFGEPTRTNSKMKEGFGQYNYQDDNQVVIYTEGRVSNITYQLDHKNNIMTEKQAKDFAQTMIPEDSTLIKQYDKDDNTRVLLYHSKTLESLFDASEFNDANGNVQLGQFDIVLIHTGDEVDSMGAMTGDNP